ncbi:tRNA dimethylallyltransferase 9 isoform X2 [Magnolia sinica]|uniref:tRNA dimethylallyltransferase 9 isoform X2 n=1 Tax=Magnolia sinica TaxID=86752 RepID=UPI002659F1AE|nr:tRNA dimethylallyltransferase 9 isoform X2 [Magnolia sinica]
MDQISRRCRESPPQISPDASISHPFREMSSGVGLRSWALRLASTDHSPLLSPYTLTRRSRSSSALPFPPRRTIATVNSTSHPNTNNTNYKKQKVIVISGPTGAGKSRLANELAKLLNGEIISADSVQVYRGLDIGSAKPSPSDRKEVRHHLVDILNPSEDYSVGQFFEDARRATRDIIESGRVPIVAGGTGLYLRWYIYGKPDVPKASPEITSKVYSELMILEKNEDWDAAVQLVMKAGDPKAQFVAANDWYRLRRSLEIIKSTGSPPSAFTVPYDSFRGQLDSRKLDPSYEDTYATGGLGKNLSKDLDYDFICFFLSSHRVDLYRQIDLRCEEMLSGSKGILSEATQLLEMGLLPNMNSATRAIGYRQAMEYLLRCREQGGNSSAGEFYAFLSEFQKASRNFAKRQMTWFRNELIYHWLDASQPLVLNFILDAYHHETGQLVVPESLRMEKDVSSRKETIELKSYRPKNRYFVRREDCSEILDWVKRTQRQLNSAWS